MSAHLLIDIVIAVHDPLRPVLRAVDSILAASRDDTRVTVVCHGIDVGSVPGLASRINERVRAVRFDDGVRSPAGPFNHGIELATAEYVAIMGSDDWLETGALDAWARLALKHDADVLLAGLSHQGGGAIRNPPVRPWRRAALDPVRDRLFHRSAPLGLIRRTLLLDPSQRLTAGLPTGEDLALSTRLFATANNLCVALDAPRYVIGADADGRVTSAAYSLAELALPVEMLFAEGWFQTLPERVRCAAVIARIRGSVLSHLSAFSDADCWSAEDLAVVRRILAHAMELAPTAFRPLPLADTRMLNALVENDVTADSAAAAVRSWTGAGLRERLLPARITYVLHPESTPVRYLGYALARLGA